MNKVYLLLGSNEGDRMHCLQQAIDAIQLHCGDVRDRSSVYETAAWGIEDQPDFLNLVLELETELSPADLLREVKQIESSMGRQRTVKWGQRTLDIDILFYNDEIIQSTNLHIPHPFLQERRFTLAPLNEIATDLVHPVLKKTVAELLEDCRDPLEARKR